MPCAKTSWSSPRPATDEPGNPPQCPAAFPGVVSVSGIDRSGRFWAPSESGKGVTVAAPASGIYSTNDQGAYVNADGTSYAAAYVSATAALIRSRFPMLSTGQVIQRLIDTASQHHAHPDAHVGYGVINPLAALTDPAPVRADRTNPLLAADQPGPSASSPLSLLLTVGGAVGAAAVTAGMLLLRRRRRDKSSAVAPGRTAGAAALKAKATPARARRNQSKPSKGRGRS